MLNKLRGIRSQGDSIKDILFYWLPEMISATMLISLTPLIDSYLIASLRSTMTLGALGMANNFLHVFIKVAEAIPVAAIAIIGRHNGSKEYGKCAQDLGDTFWVTLIIGLTFFLAIYFSAATIFSWLRVPEQMIRYGTPFLKLRSVSILLTFISLGFFAFMRGIKNTKTPMIIYTIGIIIFIFFDYALILGKFGFSKMGLMGSAVATIIQYTVIITISVWYLLSKKEYKKYFYKTFINYFNKRRAIKLLNLSWPIIIDKSSLAFSYVWLSRMIAPMGKYAIASYDVIKNLERFAFIPAVGFAQIIIFLVSNKLGANDPEGAKNNIKKVLILTAATLTISLTILCFNAKFFVSFFDPKNKFASLAAPALVFISLLVVLDFVQLILAGALRGAGDVRTVMKARFFSCLFFFTPLVYIISKLPIENQILKLVLLYGSFYLNTGVIGVILLKRIRTNKWQTKKI